MRYLGKIVETASVKKSSETPMYPYVEALLSAVLLPGPGQKRSRIIMEGDLADPFVLPSGCRFHPRCGCTANVCKRQEPDMREIPTDSDHMVAYHPSEKLELKGFVIDVDDDKTVNPGTRNG